MEWIQIAGAVLAPLGFLIGLKLFGGDKGDGRRGPE